MQKKVFPFIKHNPLPMFTMVSGCRIWIWTANPPHYHVTAAHWYIHLAKNRPMQSPIAYKPHTNVSLYVHQQAQRFALGHANSGFGIGSPGSGTELRQNQKHLKIIFQKWLQWRIDSPRGKCGRAEWVGPDTWSAAHGARRAQRELRLLRRRFVGWH